MVKNKPRVKRATQLGELVYQARKKKNLTLRKISRKTKVSFATLVDIELGVRKNPSMRAVVRSASYLKIGSRKVFKAILNDLKSENL